MDEGGRIVTEKARIVIDRPIDEVFAFVADPSNDPEWCPTVRDPEQIWGDAPIVGAEYRFMHKPGPPKYAPITARIMELDSPRRFAARSEDAQGFYLYSYELEPVDSGTQITHRTESHFTNFLRFFAPLLKGHLRKVMNGQLQTLKTLLENQSEKDRSSTRAPPLEAGPALSSRWLLPSVVWGWREAIRSRREAM